MSHIINAGKSVLLVEDEDIDQQTMQRAFRELKITNSLEIVHNGREALTRLQDNNKEIPCLILLDLNLPLMNGIEFLTEVKKDPALRKTPIVVLTTSKEEQDKLNSFDLGVAGYMLKPVDYVQFVDVVRTIQVYWTLSQLP